MRKPTIIYSPRPSEGAAHLAAMLPAYRVDGEGARSPRGERVMRRGGHTLINWGSSAAIPDSYSRNARRVLNLPASVRRAITKFDTCAQLAVGNIPTCDVTRDLSVARGWLEGGALVFRRTDGLSGGAGIEVLSGKHGPIELPELSKREFFSRYFPKTHEYRVHVVEGKAIDVQQKRRRSDRGEDYNPMIRSHANQWVFCHDNLKGTPDELAVLGTLACSAVACLGLDFGAVDILAKFSDKGKPPKFLVCEINTAPGLEGLTIQRYTDAFNTLQGSN